MRNELRHYEGTAFEKHMYFQGMSVCSKAIYRLSALVL